MLKKLIKEIINRSGYTVYKNTENPYNAFVQQRKLFDKMQPVTIFDVGANFGQTVIHYKALFPDSLIYAFEPHPEAYSRLINTTNKLKDVQTFELALGNYNGTADFYMNTYSETSSLLKNAQSGKEIWGEGAMTPAGSKQVNISTLDSFMKTHSVPVIDILKLDTQGTEYQIIEGASHILSLEKIRLIYTEIITLPTYNNQKEILETMQLLYDYSFRLYGVYNQHYSANKLSSVDVIFLHNNF
jgi:FkbM family methyltransferase